MALGLQYRINEGMGMTESLENGGIKSIEFIVREITSSLKGVKVKFELRYENIIQYLELPESRRYNLLPRCTLHIPKNPSRINQNNSHASPSRKRNPQNEERVFLKLYAPREVKFSYRKMYLL